MTPPKAIRLVVGIVLGRRSRGANINHRGQARGRLIRPPPMDTHPAGARSRPLRGRKYTQRSSCFRSASLRAILAGRPDLLAGRVTTASLMAALMALKYHTLLTQPRRRDIKSRRAGSLASKVARVSRRRQVGKSAKSSRLIDIIARRGP